MNIKEKGIVGRQSPVSIPPTAPTLVAPHSFKNKAPKTSKTASTTINILSMGGGTKTLVVNITEPKRADKINLFGLRNIFTPFLKETDFDFKSLM